MSEGLQTLSKTGNVLATLKPILDGVNKLVQGQNIIAGLKDILDFQKILGTLGLNLPGALVRLFLKACLC